MLGFNVSESARFDTKKQAENYIAIQNSICYHTREEASRYRQPKNPRTMCQHSPGILLFFYSGKAPTRLFVVPVFTVKPFSDEMANHTC